MPRILVDLSHNEDYKKIPKDIFDLDYIFDFINYADTFPSFDELREHCNLLIIGNIIPAENHIDHLFKSEELHTIIKYVEAGGSLLLTTSSGGDFNYGREKQSIRNFSRITGVRKYWWGELFTNNKDKHSETTEDIIFEVSASDYEFSRDFINNNHPVFQGVNKFLFSDSTFLKTSPKKTNLIVYNTDTDIKYRSFSDYKEYELKPNPIIVINENAGRGRTITIGSTSFMTDHPQYGIDVFDNKRLFKNIISWLLHQI